MTVGELITELMKYDSEDVVIVPADGEGNTFNELYALETLKYDPDSGETGLRELTEDLVEIGYSNSDVMEHGVNAIVLWP